MHDTTGALIPPPPGETSFRKCWIDSQVNIYNGRHANYVCMDACLPESFAALWLRHGVYSTATAHLTLACQSRMHDQLWLEAFTAYFH